MPFQLKNYLDYVAELQLLDSVLFGGQRWLKFDAAGFQHTERQGDDGGIGLESFKVAMPEVHFDLPLVLPLDAFNSGVVDEFAATPADFRGEKMDEPAVAFIDAGLFRSHHVFGGTFAAPQ